MTFLKLGTRLRGLRPAELAKKCLAPGTSSSPPRGSAESEDFVIIAFFKENKALNYLHYQVYR